MASHQLPLTPPAICNWRQEHEGLLGILQSWWGHFTLTASFQRILPTAAPPHSIFFFFFALMLSKDGPKSKNTYRIFTTTQSVEEAHLYLFFSPVSWILGVKLPQKI